MTMTIEEELALIHKKGQAAPSVVPIPDAPASADMPTPAPSESMTMLSSAFQDAIKPVTDTTAPPPPAVPLDDAPSLETGLAALPSADAGASTWDVMGATWTRDTITTDAWDYAEGKRRDLTEQMYRALPPEAQARADDSQRDHTTDWRSFEQKVMDEAAKFVATDPTKWGDLPLTQEQFEARLNDADKAALADAEAVLNQPGGAITEFFTSMARSVTKPESLALMPFGGGAGSFAKFVVGETLLAGVGSVAALPGQYDAADRLDLPTPDAVTQVSTDMMFGGLFAGGLAGIPLAIGKGLNWAKARERAKIEARPDGENPLDFGASVDRAQAEMTGDRTVQEATKSTFDWSKHRTQGALREDSISGLQPKFVSSLEGLIASAPPGIRDGLSVFSGFRSIEHQQELWDASDKSGKMVARPGHSKHNHGEAVDLEWKGQRLDKAPPEVQAWVAANLEKFGLTRPMDYEPWHIEPIGARGGNRSSSPITLPPGSVPYNEAAVFRALTGAESSGVTNARNPKSSAAGIGQILSGTWFDLIKKHRPDLAEGRSANEILALRDDPKINAELTMMYTRDNYAALSAAGLPNGPGELYLAHFMGTDGATRALSAPLNTPISRLMTPKQIAANSDIRFGGKSFADFTAGDLRRWSARKMRSAYDPNASVDMPSFSGGGTSRGYTGSGQVTAGDGTRIDVDYEVVDYASLIRASGDLQPRDRSRINSDAWIADTAARLDPAQLMPSPNAAQGTPIVGPDNMIESGNGRVSAIGRAYERVPDRAQAYRAAIEAAGYTIPEGVTQPVLIARRTSKLDAAERQRFVIEAQDSGVAQMTPTEVARATARNLQAPILARLDPTQPIISAANGDFVRAALATLPRSARNAMFDASGALNGNGQRQLREALFARAWPDPDILARYTEGGSPDLKSLLEALETAAPNWAALRADIEAGLVSPEMDISGYVLDAMRLIGAARDMAARNNKTIAKALGELLDQVDMLDGAVAPLTTALVRKFWQNGRAASADDIATFLGRYADEARNAGKAGGMFDAATPRDVLRTVDASSFADLPDDLGRVRGFATPTAPQAAMGDEAFTEGAQSPEVEAVNAEIAASIRQRQPDTPPLSDVLKGTDPDKLVREVASRQPVNTIEDLYARSAPAQARLATVAARIADDLGLPFKDPGLKDRAKAIKKMARKGYTSPRNLTDISRAGFTVKALEDADSVVEKLAAEFDLIDEGWVRMPTGYIDRKVIIIHDDGMLSEVQFWTEPMRAAKSEGGPLYQLARDLPPSSPELPGLLTRQQEIYAAATGDLNRITFSADGISAVPRLREKPATKASFDGRTAAVSQTSSASTETQSLPGSSWATAKSAPDPSRNSTAGRPSQLQYDSNSIGEVPLLDTPNVGAEPGLVNSADPILDQAAAANFDAQSAISAARNAGGDFEIKMPDGTIYSAAEVLDDIDADANADFQITFCTTNGAD